MDGNFKDVLIKVLGFSDTTRFASSKKTKNNMEESTDRQCDNTMSASGTKNMIEEQTAITK
jgi:hypothetical protein